MPVHKGAVGKACIKYKVCKNILFKFGLCPKIFCSFCMVCVDCLVCICCIRYCPRMPAPSVSHGSRIEVSGSRGFVRFLGVLPGRGDGVVWVGVDWDEPSRGKHDGTVDGVRRFTAEQPTSGSFVKLSKLESCVQRSLLDAVAYRHHNGVVPGDAGSRHIELPMNVGGVGGRTELVGAEIAAERQARIRDATRVTLRQLGVSSVEDPFELSSKLRNVRYLDLAESLLSDVFDILRLFQGLPNLHTLDLSGNRFDVDRRNDRTLIHSIMSQLSSSASESASCRPCRTSTAMRVFVLNRSNLPWNIVRALSSACPSLEELRLYRADLSSLTACEKLALEYFSSRQVFKNLRLLDLGGNELCWNDLVSVFGKLPNLESMFVSENAIGNIRFSPDGGELFFPNLASLSLSGNPIDDWRSISELWVLPSLKALRIQNIPLLEAEIVGGTSSRGVSELDGRNGLIARLGGLDVLDGSSITLDERRYAEKRYALSCLGHISGSEIPDASLIEHPRLLSLCEEYDLGPFAEERVTASGTSASTTIGAGAKGLSRTLADDLVHCTFVSLNELPIGKPTTLRARVPVSISVGRLAGVAARMFGGICSLDVASMDLVDSAGQAQERVSRLDDEARDLRQFGLVGGESVCINVRCGYQSS